MKKIYSIMPILLIIVAFGPYLSFSIGIRVEHIVLYPFVLLLVFYIFAFNKVILIKPIFYIFSIWLITFVIIVISTLNYSGLNIGLILADVENFIQPLAIMLIFLTTIYLVSLENLEKKISAVSKTLIFLICLNTLWIFVGFLIDTTAINAYFWGTTEQTTATNAAQMGRYSGIFNQPSEAGIMYSIALGAWLYLTQKNGIKLINSVTLILILIGGIVTVSKIFLFGGILLFIVFLLLGGMSIFRLVKTLLPSAVIGAIGYQFLKTTWTGQDYLLRFFKVNDQTNILSLFTAGRFGGGNQQQSLFESVAKENAFIGIGFGQHGVVDSGFFHFFGSAGLVGLIIYVILLISFLLMAIKYLKKLRWNPESRLFAFIVILILGGSFGVPVLTLNRVSIVIWVFICLLLRYFSFAKKSSNIQNTKHKNRLI